MVSDGHNNLFSTVKNIKEFKSPRVELKSKISNLSSLTSLNFIAISEMHLFPVTTMPPNDQSSLLSINTTYKVTKRVSFVLPEGSEQGSFNSLQWV